MTQRTPSTDVKTALLAGFKSHIRMTGTDLDSELGQKLMAAIYHAEHHIGKVILKSRFVTSVPFTSTLRLKAPNTSVVSLQVDGESSTDFTLNGCILHVGGTGEQMTVTYDAGYETIPEDMKAAIFMHAASLFNNPTDSVETLAKASQNLLRPYRSWGLDDGEQV